MKDINTMKNLVVTPAIVLFNNDTYEELILLTGEEVNITLDSDKIFTGEIVSIDKEFVEIKRELGISRFTFNLIKEITTN